MSFACALPAVAVRLAGGAWDGKSAGTLTLKSRRDAGRHVISGKISPDATYGLALDLMLRTQSCCTTITDFTMRSLRLISVRQE